jgi:biopolymer transport protein ExbD
MSPHAKKLAKTKAATRLIPEEDPEFQIAPMIDILLVLLVFFMSIATDQVMQVNKDVVLPIAKVEEEKNKKEGISEVIVNIIWNLDNTGRIDVDGKGTMEFPQLTEFISNKREQATNANIENFKVKIRADKRCRYQYVRSVMAAIGAAKVPHVIFSAVDKELEQPK